MDLYWCDLRRWTGETKSEALHHRAGRLLLRLAWRRRFGTAPMPPLCTGPRGKPGFGQAVPVWFSISHSGHIAACAFGFQPVGLDVEAVGEAHPELYPYFRPEEQAWLAAGDRLRFYRLFTVKESYVKLTGEGLAALPELDTAIGADGKPLERLGGAAVFPLCLWLPDCAGAVCLYHPEAVLPRELSPEQLL